MKLYAYFRSSAVFRTRIVVNLKGVDCETVYVDLRGPVAAHTKPEYLAVNPQGLIPALVVDGTTVAQSLAIIEYLDEVYPEPPLLPRPPVDRARVRAMALAVACDLHPLNNLRVLNYLRSPLGHDQDTVNTWYRHWIAVGFSGLEQEARRASGDGRHMFGSSVTIADVCIVPQMYNARRFKCDLEPYPTLRGICAYLESLPAFAKAAPEAQPDAS
ncbi:MAG: maleylacetoacetate isomerase [Sinobacteraceae bacterium]|nr:maleylacetoacetate isomerase [Nevskiaceae bacterium]